MGCPVEGQVLVDLVGDGDEVVLSAQPGDPRQLVGGEHGAGGVVRGVDDDRPSAGGDRGGQFVRVEGVPAVVGGRPERNRAAHSVGERDHRGVGVVHGLEQHHFVARFDEGEDARRNARGGSNSDVHLGCGVVGKAVALLPVRGDGGAGVLPARTRGDTG